MDSSSVAQIRGGRNPLSSSFCVESIVCSSAFRAVQYCRVIEMTSMPKMINIWSQIPPAQRRGGNLDHVLQLLVLSAIYLTYRQKILISDAAKKASLPCL